MRYFNSLRQICYFIGGDFLGGSPLGMLLKYAILFHHLFIEICLCTYHVSNMFWTGISCSKECCESVTFATKLRQQVLNMRDVFFFFFFFFFFFGADMVKPMSYGGPPDVTLSGSTSSTPRPGSP